MTKHPKPGRPPFYPEAMPRINVRLDRQTVEDAKKLGDGNLSKGIRMAVKTLTTMKLLGKV